MVDDFRTGGAREGTFPLVQAIHHTDELFEGLVRGVRARLEEWAKEKGGEVYTFPPVMHSSMLHRSGYYANFPQFVGAIFCFHGDPEEALLGAAGLNADWYESNEPTDLVMTPAACYPIYPMVAAEGALPEGGVVRGAFSYCFRREPSLQLARLQSFRMQEVIAIGEPEDVKSFREESMRFAQGFTAKLGLSGDVVVASDPFFGRLGRLVAEAQRVSEYKFELILPISVKEKEVACMSFNYHVDHFGNAWGINTAAGNIAHSACFAVGIERIVLAVMNRHGREPRHWPVEVQSLLALK